MLLGENVFYPYTPPSPSRLQKPLNPETAAAKRAGFPIKVALIASPIDLGVIPGLFGKPQKYADFLDQEISFRGKQPLLVVMAAGYGTQGLPAAGNGGRAALPGPPAGPAPIWRQAAITAVAGWPRPQVTRSRAYRVTGTSSGGGGAKLHNHDPAGRRCSWPRWP